MTITSYQVDSVIRAYTKQYKSRAVDEGSEVAPRDPYNDVVTLSQTPRGEGEIFQKISYSLLDIIRKGHPPGRE
ncbi:MAG TPA: hypothetical protein PK836_02740 [Syntrophales bacterium]|nr:hypothetical protein [Syntrophales bacterium]HOM06865.1 hypothetical protein [Syntrophales bacterium]HPC00581.1 hypothetical protein [Syntrophales bacterium]HPQ06406.1 hypothetical protein [Syntrophales bacterium]HRV42175.1 hypothetical protein [Syntrophales bacterium]